MTRGDERDLIRRLLAGDGEAFDRFAERYVPALYRFASSRLDGDRELTRDIVQSTLCKAIAKLETFRGDAALATWLCACCRSEIAGHFRRQRRLSREVQLEPAKIAGIARTNPLRSGPEHALLRKEHALLVHMALDLLPPRYGKALEWKYLENLSVGEIAERLEVGVKAAESLLSRARESFRKSFRRLASDGPRSVEVMQRVETRKVAQS